MREARLEDGTRVACVRRSEAIVLDDHVRAYLGHGITLGADPIVFDVGANIGLFGVRTVQRHPGAKVFSFEPIPEIHAALAENARRMGGMVPLRCGLSDIRGEAVFSYFPLAPALSTAFPEMWDVEPGAFTEAVRGVVREAPASLAWIRWLPDGLIPVVAWGLRRGMRRVSCPLRTVSEIIDEHGLDRIDLLKIDCEGAELAVLHGIADRHWPLVRQVVAEVHDRDGRLDAVLALFARHGLDLVETERDPGVGDAALINVFARRSS